MIRRTALAGLATAALVSSTLMLAGPASAADDGSQCTITDILPHKVVIGTEGKRVQFGVKTTCDDQDIRFSVRGTGIGTSAHTFWFAACDYTIPPGPTNFDCTHSGSGVINPIGGTYRGYDFVPGNDLAGAQAIYAFAFVDANHNGKDDDEQCTDDTCDTTDRDSEAGTITLLRQTRFDGTFDASPEPVRKGKPITVSATLSTADWNAETKDVPGTWAGVDASVNIQFKAANEKSYHTVKTVTATAGQVNTTVEATRSGSWRAYYPGSDVTAASSSNSDYVKVKSAH